MKIILFRHGPAATHRASKWPDDGLRPLTAAGRDRTRAAARGLVRIENDLRLILTSPLVRALQTAEILRDVTPGARLEPLDALATAGSLRDVIRHVARLESDIVVALVGHEPDLGALAGRLVLRSDKALPLKKAGACVIAFVGPVRAGSGHLVGFYPPRALRRMAGKRSKT